MSTFRYGADPPKNEAIVALECRNDVIYAP
jgi:hypothetical protein